MINGERAYQNAAQGNSRRHEGMPELTPGETLSLIRVMLRQCEDEWYTPDGEVTCLNYLRKIAASAVRCMELWGAPPRAGWEAQSDAGPPVDEAKLGPCAPPASEGLTHVMTNLGWTRIEKMEQGSDE